MWVFFGIIAIAAAVCNIVQAVRRRQAKWFAFISLAFTAFTVCAHYSLVKNWVLRSDLSALEDVVPGMAGALWVLVIASVLINSVALFIKDDR